MKKNKNEQSTPDFKNNPFKSLKGIAVKQHAAPQSKPVAKREKKAPSPEHEAELFFRAVAGAKKIDEHEEGSIPSHRKEVKPIKPLDAHSHDDNHLFLQAMKNMGPHFQTIARDRDEEKTEQRSSSSRMRQLKRGTVHISQELDLHGYVKDEALKRLEHFIAAAYSQAREAVLVITGKGTNSPEGPVLQGAVDAWLRGKGKGMVAEFSPAPRDKGGSGAVVVFLKKKK